MEKVNEAHGLVRDEDVVRQEWVFGEWDGGLVEEQLGWMRVENSFVVWISEGVRFGKGVKKTKDVDYEFEYSVEDFDQELLEMYEVVCKKPENIARFDLPAPNPFIPKDFEILAKTLEAKAKANAGPQDQDSAEELTLTEKLHRDHFSSGPGVPVKILEQVGCDAWYKLDTVHRVPKCSMFFEVYHLMKDE